MGRKKVVIPLQRHGSYYVNGHINDKSVTFLVDTGASVVAISGDMAKNLGVEVNHDNIQVSSTAAGYTNSYPVIFDKISVGNRDNTIVRRNVRGSVIPEMEGSRILLGMSFLGDEIDFIQDDNLLILYDDSSSSISEKDSFENSSSRSVTSSSESLKIRMQIQANIQEIGIGCFPDDIHAIWNILSIEQENNGIFLVETLPVPHVGYEKIRFHLVTPDREGVVRADCWECGSWSVLFTSS
ncbi:MAG: hypothetical protein CMB17_06355 [Euryarchaeota archaeon]|jgi:aspartyl protease family protein|nr:hypothetical protein [Euryarchaeota archaeon]|tara:strand:- start:1652 stop:2371 length:720 start_codon:yes stop_codon:yes gene_type:complete